MIAPRWKKAFRDLLLRRGRAALAVLAMAAGIFEISGMLYKYALLQPTLNTMYGRTTPSSATFVLDRLDDALVDSVRRVPGVAAAEARPVVVARARVGADVWVPALLYVVRDFDHQQMDTFRREAGAWPPAAGDVLIERTGLQVAKAAIGDAITLRAAGREDVVATVSGTVYAAGLAPAWMEHMVPGFIAWDSPLRGGDGESAQLRILVADHPLEEGWIREVADSVQAMLERNGETVRRVTVPPPGRHPHAAQMEAFLFLLLSFGILSLVLSAVLIAGLVHAWMAEQVREVGILKTLGARDLQVAGIYLGQVAMLAGAALIVGVPPGLLMGRAYAKFAAGILNADLLNNPFPFWVLGVVAVVGVGVPLLFALGPVMRASRISIREALADAPALPPAGPWARAFAWLPRPVALSLRASFGRPGRLALTLGMLGMGGAVFVSALNVAADWTRSVDDDYRRRRFDVTVGFAEPQPITVVAALLAGVPEVRGAEYWAGASPYLVKANGIAGDPVTMVGMEPGTPMMALATSEGRWLASGDREGAVVNAALTAMAPTIGVGDSVRVRLKGRNATLPVVGIARELNPMPTIYTSRSAVLAVSGLEPPLTRSARIALRRTGATAELDAARRLEQAFEEAGIEVTGLQRMSDAKQGILDHLVIILTILTLASLVVVFVGSLALTSTLTLNVIQRTREIGILGAIGARPSTIARHVWLEGVLLGVASWAVAMVIAAPITWALESACGRIFFRLPLPFYISPQAAFGWLGLVVVLASISSFYPARKAARQTIREALAHT